MKVEIVGVRRSESKGRKVFNYYGLKEFTEYEIENSECDGKNVVSEFSYQDFAVFPGDIVEFSYEPGYQGRATLVDVKVITPAGKAKTNQAGGN